MKYRRQRASSRPDESPTYRKILDQAVAVLLEDGFDRFSVQRVLDGADVSRATLYRYFSDVDGLITLALVETFCQEVDYFLNIAIELVERSEDASSFREEVRRFFETFASIPQDVRLRRTHIYSLASTRVELATAVASAQESLTTGWAEMLHEGQRRGFIRNDFDTRAAAVMLQGMALGRIIDDAAMTHVTNEQWAHIYFEFVNRALLTEQH